MLRELIARGPMSLRRRVGLRRRGAAACHDRRGDAMPDITPFLWFDTEAEEAANFYTSLFPNSRILEVTRYGSAGPGDEAKVMTVSFELNGQKFVGLNGGPAHTFSEAVSFVVNCEDQDEVDSYWEKLS